MISVIIPSYNAEKTIERCLQSLRTQACSRKYEIILVDSSTDRTAEIVQSHFPEIVFIHLSRKTDPGMARNIGIQRSRGEIVAFIDADCTAAPGWLEKIAAAHEGQYAAVGGAVNNANDPADRVAMAGYLAEFREFVPGRPRAEVDHIPTCNISYKRSVFHQYGMFDGTYYPQEDLVFNHYLSSSGERILFDPAIQVSHCHRSGLRDFLRHQKRIGTATARVLKVTGHSGAFVVHHPLLAPVMLPLLPAVKFVRTLRCFARYHPGLIAKNLSAVMLFAFGLLFWTAGFCSGIYRRS